MAKVVDPVKVLWTFVERYKTRLEACQALGVGYQYMSDMLYARRAVSVNVLKKLGLKTVAVRAGKKGEQ